MVPFCFMHTLLSSWASETLTLPLRVNETHSAFIWVKLLHSNKSVTEDLKLLKYPCDFLEILKIILKKCEQWTYDNVDAVKIISRTQRVNEIVNGFWMTSLSVDSAWTDLIASSLSTPLNFIRNSSKDEL